MVKTIAIEDKTWRKLSRLKINKKLNSIEKTIDYLLASLNYCVTSHKEIENG